MYISRSIIIYLRYAKIAVATIGCVSCHRTLRASRFANNYGCAFIDFGERIFTCGDYSGGCASQREKQFYHGGLWLVNVESLSHHKEMNCVSKEKLHSAAAYFFYGNAKCRHIKKRSTKNSVCTHEYFLWLCRGCLKAVQIGLGNVFST